jgi:hypothetical protein
MPNNYSIQKTYLKNNLIFLAKKSGAKGKGFGSQIPTKTVSEPDGSTENNKTTDNNLSSELLAADSDSSKLNSKKSVDANDVFSKYGVETDTNKATSKSKSKAKKPLKGQEELAFGEKVLETIPVKTQILIDNVLVTITFGALLFVVSSGVGISIAALQVVYPTFTINEQLDELIKNFLSPVFTPALIFFLICSSTFGLFKYAQISSSKTVYKE